MIILCINNWYLNESLPLLLHYYKEISIPFIQYIIDLFMLKESSIYCFFIPSNSNCNL